MALDIAIKSFNTKAASDSVTAFKAEVGQNFSNANSAHAKGVDLLNSGSKDKKMIGGLFGNTAIATLEALKSADNQRNSIKKEIASIDAEIDKMISQSLEKASKSGNMAISTGSEGLDDAVVDYKQKFAMGLKNDSENQQKTGSSPDDEKKDPVRDSQLYSEAYAARNAMYDTIGDLDKFTDEACNQFSSLKDDSESKAFVSNSNNQTGKSDKASNTSDNKNESQKKNANNANFTNPFGKDNESLKKNANNANFTNPFGKDNESLKKNANNNFSLLNITSVR